MQQPLETLRQRLESLPEATGAAPRRGMPPFELRYAVEAREGAALPTEAAVAAALGSYRFLLQPLFAGKARAGGDGALPRFALLAFPGLDRRRFATQTLFEIGYGLGEALDLVSAEPDLNSDHGAEPEPPVEGGTMVEGIDQATWCWVDTPPPENRRWALDRLGVPEAWAIAPGRGRGVLIAQPDTGVAAHAELDGAPIRLDLSADIVDGEGEAVDPLLASAGNPGHGTGTASVLISGPGGQVSGSAPGAELVPIRCIESVIVVDGTPVARALDHARHIGAQVVSMSLGGLPSRAVSAAIAALVEDGCVVLAAAGNCVGEVVYPARYPHCIAVAGTNAEDRPWRGSSRGAAVDIAAPGELVWRALRQAPDHPTDAVTGGQGTSFATALAAGVVALWISHHGRSALLAEARRRGVSLQTLCRAAMQATARTPPGWDAGAYGSGILCADALLRLAPRDIPAAAEAPEEDPDEAVGRMVAEIAGQPDPRRFGLELEKLRLDAARAAAAGAVVEEAGSGTSPTLARAMVRSFSPPLAAPAVPPLPRPQERGRSAAAYLRILGGSGGGALESASASPGALPEALLVRALERRFAAADRGHTTPADEETRRLRQTVLGDAERALAETLRDPDQAPMDRRSVVALEALVRLKGRPSLLVQNDGFDAEDRELDDNWIEFLALAGPRVTRLIRATGRLELDGHNTGTGFVVAPGLVMTNRHVLEQLVEEPTGRDGWCFRGIPTINFAAEWGSEVPRQVFRVTGIRHAGPAVIGRNVDLRKLDLALLEVEERVGTETLPPPVTLVANVSAGQGRHELAAVGHPGRPHTLPRQADGRLDPEVVAALERIFRFRYDVKRLALGQVDRRLGTLVGDAQPPWAFGHDATTLGGNSGSPLALQGDDGEGGLPVLGLHMGGQWLDQNYAHLLAAIPALREAGLDFRWTHI